MQFVHYWVKTKISHVEFETLFVSQTPPKKENVTVFSQC